MGKIQKGYAICDNCYYGVDKNERWQPLFTVAECPRCGSEKKAFKFHEYDSNDNLLSNHTMLFKFIVSGYLDSEKYTEKEIEKNKEIIQKMWDDFKNSIMDHYQ